MRITSNNPIIDSIYTVPQILVIDAVATVIGVTFLARQHPELGSGGFAVMFAVMNVAFGRAGPLGAIRIAVTATVVFVALWSQLLRQLYGGDDHADDAP